MQAFMERVPNPSLSCELKLSVSFTGSSRYRAKASEHDPVPRVRMISEFRWYHGLVIVRPKPMNIGLGLFVFKNKMRRCFDEIRKTCGRPFPGETVRLHC